MRTISVCLVPPFSYSAKTCYTRSSSLLLHSYWSQSTTLPFTHPLLSVAVLQVIEVSIFPADADAQQISRFKTILSQDHKVGEESCQSLDHPCE